MPNKCCVPNCKSNKNQQIPGLYVPMFSFPRDESMRSLWVKNIPKPNLIVTKNMRVCMHHFKEEFVIRNHEATRPDGTKLCLPRKKLTLKKEAVPTIFKGTQITPNNTRSYRNNRSSRAADQLVIPNNCLKTALPSKYRAGTSVEALRVATNLFAENFHASTVAAKEKYLFQDLENATAIIVETESLEDLTVGIKEEIPPRDEFPEFSNTTSVVAKENFILSTPLSDALMSENSSNSSDSRVSSAHNKERFLLEDAVEEFVMKTENSLDSSIEIKEEFLFVDVNSVDIEEDFSFPTSALKDELYEEY